MEDETGGTEIIDDVNALQFSAFISYSHADAATVRKLHSKIESYRLPKGLGSIDALNRRKGRVGKIFRDREDLSAAHDLSTAVKDALERSQVLVVACSPDAKASQWVDQEIAHFRQCHPDRPILAAILRGEPHEAFPAALTEGGAEPLAADLRRQGDGWRLGFLKVVAGIAGVPLDRLVQRDSQRQVRRVMAVTGLVALVAVAMGAMTTIALQARNEARFQQAEAEGLVEYMLTDLREDLTGAAGLSVMTKVNRRALAYYEAQKSLENWPSESLARRARVIGELGEDAQNRKEFNLAEQNYLEKARTTQELLKDNPNDPSRKFDHALSLNRLALLAEEVGQLELAVGWFEESWELLININALDSDEFEWQRAAVLVAGNLCAIAAISHDVRTTTLEMCRLATGIGRELAETDTRPARSAYDLAFNLMWQGDVLAHLGHAEEAALLRSRARGQTDRLATANPNNRKILEQKMEIYAHLAPFRSPCEERAMIEVSKNIAKQLIRMDPDRASWADSRRKYEIKLEGMKNACK